MKAVGYTETGPIDRPDALIDFEADTPTATGHDLLVKVEAISVNPVDTKIRQRRAPKGETPDILGWDAAGKVVGVGEAATNFSIGDRVYYAGAVHRPGTNSEFHLVDERIVGKAPSSISTSSAAAMPLTTLTAYEMLFDRLRINSPVPGGKKTLLVIGGGGGVGSITIQLARALSDMTIIATASRPETKAWVEELGAHHVVSHAEPLCRRIEALGVGSIDFVYSTTHSNLYSAEVAGIMTPQGRYGLIDDPETFDIMPYKSKAISVHWEFMFTRPMFETADMQRQGDILNEVAALIDASRIKSTVAESFGTINAANLIKAHALLESGKSKGKIVLEGF
ncbi:zinc-binding alcohol dehydrogenase family protein [Ruegeria sp. 2205SS24-7]|uniref:zinc-binding alcohol dehydrogenase family protein n=1 Tax=Ruegeria discodermiae TaxID=3064389 RepID=UPI00274080B0|nr:zinc-binding alcohol dehydrogenase family protein [Ruegeria sp. 2205SS24-7]MDP5219826.1 zinc-binding alcohol dehydrogenase family protein [Ruegeria sp. 2205SS24-7]